MILFVHRPHNAVPTFGNIAGGSGVLVSGPRFNTADNIKCMFGDQNVNGVVLDNETVLCTTQLGQGASNLLFKQTSSTMADLLLIILKYGTEGDVPWQNQQHEHSQRLCGKYAAIIV